MILVKEALMFRLILPSAVTRSWRPCQHVKKLGKQSDEDIASIALIDGHPTRFLPFFKCKKMEKNNSI